MNSFSRSIQFLACSVLLGATASGQPVSRTVFGSYFQTGSPPSLLGAQIGANSYASADRDGNTYLAAIQTTPCTAPYFECSPIHATIVSKIPASGGKTAATTTLAGALTTGITVDTAGSVYLTGLAESAFQTTANALRKDGPGFVVKLASDGAILFATRVLGSPAALAVDSAGAVYLTGSADGNFRTSIGAYKPEIGISACAIGRDPVYVPCPDAFVTKIGSDGATLLYATLLGGTQSDFGQAIAVDATGSAVVAGETHSADFSMTPGAFQTRYGGTVTLGPLEFGDGFAARLDPTGSKLIYATYLGGTGVDTATGVAVDASQNAYLSGITRSRDFPVTPGAFQTVYGGDRNPMPAVNGDAFFVKLTPDGQARFASYLGSPDEDRAGGIALGPGNQLYLAVTGSLLPTLERRSASSCDPLVALIAIDRDSGKVTDWAGVPGVESVPPDLAVDGLGVAHLSGIAAAVPSAKFALTANAIATGGDVFVSRIDFTRKDLFEPRCIMNAASLEQHPYYNPRGVTVAPGEIISIFGVGLGPATGVSASGNPLPGQLSGVSAKLGDTPLALLYVSDRQVNAIVPYSASVGDATLTINSGAFQGAYNIQVAPVFPGFFTQDGSGRNATSTLNQDFSVNSAANPADKGSIVSFYLTGLGPLTAPLPGNSLTPLSGPWPVLKTPLQVVIVGGVDGVLMDILYAGPAPGLPPGVYQVNVRIPTNSGSGALLLRAGFPDGDARWSQDGVTVFVK